MGNICEQNTQEMCNSAVGKDPWMLMYVPDKYMSQEMCNNAVLSEPKLFVYVPDYFVTKEMLKMGGL